MNLLVFGATGGTLHGVPRISRADVAHFVLTEMDKRAFIRKTAVVSD